MNSTISTLYSPERKSKIVTIQVASSHLCAHPTAPTIQPWHGPVGVAPAQRHRLRRDLRWQSLAGTNLMGNPLWKWRFEGENQTVDLTLTCTWSKWFGMVWWCLSDHKCLSLRRKGNWFNCFTNNEFVPSTSQSLYLKRSSAHLDQPLPSFMFCLMCHIGIRIN